MRPLGRLLLLFMYEIAIQWTASAPLYSVGVGVIECRSMEHGQRRLHGSCDFEPEGRFQRKSATLNSVFMLSQRENHSKQKGRW